MSESESTVSNRRMQLLVTGMLSMYIYLSSVGLTILYFCLMFYGNIYIRYLCIFYGVFYLYDYETPSKGGRGVGCEWFRNLTLWKHFIDYFPIDLVKAAELPPDQNYLLAVFPHGILSFGAVGNCITNHSKWRSYFPGVRAKLVTLHFLTALPIFREVILSWGMCNANASSLKKLLNQPNDLTDESNSDGFTSNGTVLVVGGAEEAFLSSPNTYKIILKKRKGFVRIALQCGAPIVPVILFGEVNAYSTIQINSVSIWRKIQAFVKKHTTVAPVIFNGRGFLQKRFGIIPKRGPITMVVGAPITTTKTLNPTEAEVNEMHQLFSLRLTELFEEHKSKYLENHEQIFLEMV